MWSICNWNHSGQWCKGNSSDLDIISEWVEVPEVNWSAMPAWAQWVAMDADGDWYYFDDQPIARELSWGYEDLTGKTYGLIPKPFRLAFYGDWKDSLVERPKA